MGSSVPQGAEFQVCSVVIRTNLSSDRREEAEMKGKEQLRLSQKLGVRRKENHVFFSSPPSVPVERNALAEWQKRAAGVTAVFFPNSTCTTLPSQAGSPNKTTALTDSSFIRHIKGNRLL